MKKTVSDLDLIENLQNGVDVDGNFEELVDRHSGIYYRVAQNYFGNGKWEGGSQTSIDKDFIFNSMDSVIYCSAIEFNPKKGAKFSSHLFNKARFFCLKHINSSRVELGIMSKDKEEDEPKEGSYVEDFDFDSSDFLAKKIFDIMVWLKSLKDDRPYEVFNLRYFSTSNGKPLPWKKVSDEISLRCKKSLSDQGCLNMHNRYVKMILEESSSSSSSELKMNQKFS